jgi:hypothetical protein
MIVRIRRLCLLFVLPLFSLLAQTLSDQPISRTDLQVQLFGLRSFSPSPLTPLQDVSTASPSRKSVGLAALYSLILPGMGEWYAGGFSSGKYFLVAEGGLWLTYTAFNVYGDALRDDSRSFAVAHAGVQTAGKNDQFFVDIGNFMSVSEYNDKKLRDRSLDRLYDPAQGYAWQWDSDLSRSTYRGQRVSSDNVYNNRKFVVAAVIINHVASAINAARSAISRNKELTDRADLLVGAQVMGVPGQVHGVLVTIRKTF